MRTAVVLDEVESAHDEVVREEEPQFVQERLERFPTNIYAFAIETLSSIIIFDVDVRSRSPFDFFLPKDGRRFAFGSMCGGSSVLVSMVLMTARSNASRDSAGGIGQSRRVLEVNVSTSAILLSVVLLVYWWGTSKLGPIR